MKLNNFLVGWIVLQLVIIGLANGAIWRECVETGRIASVEIRETTFADYVVPVVMPLVAFIPETVCTATPSPKLRNE